MRNCIVSVTLLIVPVLLSAGCHGGVRPPLIPFTEVNGTQVLPVTITELQVKTCVGNITVIGNAKDEIDIEAKVKLRRHRVTPDAPTGGFEDHVHVTTRSTRLMVEDAHMDRLDKEDWSVSLLIHVPARLEVTLSAAVGALCAEDITANVDLTTGVGRVTVSTPRASDVIADSGVGDIDIRADVIAGSVDATTGIGNVVVHVNQSPPGKDVRMSTGIGNVQLSLPAETVGRFKLRTDTGSITLLGYDGLSVEHGLTQATADGTIGQGGPTYEIWTGVGSITVR